MLRRKEMLRYFTPAGARVPTLAPFCRNSCTYGNVAANRISAAFSIASSAGCIAIAATGRTRPDAFKASINGFTAPVQQTPCTFGVIETIILSALDNAAGTKGSVRCPDKSRMTISASSAQRPTKSRALSTASNPSSYDKYSSWSVKPA